MESQIVNRVLDLTAAALFVASSALVAQSPATPGPSGGVLLKSQACFDVQAYDLRIQVFPDRKAIRASLAMTAEAVEETQEIALHLDGRLEVEAVSVNAAPVSHQHERGLITIKLKAPLKVGASFVVKVNYAGQPRIAPRPPWVGGFTWSKTKAGAHWIATSCQGEGADLWWPCKDHPSDEPKQFDLRVTTPSDLFCAGPGTLQSDQENEDGTRTVHWKVMNPINNYGVALNIAPYLRLQSSFKSVGGETVPVEFYALPENEKKARAILPQFIDHVKHMEEICGPYPFRNEKYGVAETPHLGMEHQTMIGYGNRFRPGKFQRKGFAYDWLHHHEMCHEWWANLVTCRDWKDMWIHEGIGTYMQALYLESRRSEAAYVAEMRQNLGRIVNARPIAPRESRDSQAIYFSPSGGKDSDIYFKGSWVCHTLRYLLGDEAFFKVLRRWAYPDPKSEKLTDGTQTRFSDTEEIRAIAEKVSGRELGWFFEIYLRSAALPEVISREENGRLYLKWKTPGDLPFPMPLDIKLGGKTQTLKFKAGEEVSVALEGRAYRIDPKGRILMKRARRRR